MADDNDNVVVFPGVTTADIPIRRMLDNTDDAILDMGMVIGWENDGSLYLESSRADVAEIVYLLEKAKAFVVHGLVDE